MVSRSLSEVTVHGGLGRSRLRVDARTRIIGDGNLHSGRLVQVEGKLYAGNRLKAERVVVGDRVPWPGERDDYSGPDGRRGKDAEGEHHGSDDGDSESSGHGSDDERSDNSGEGSGDGGDNSGSGREDVERPDNSGPGGGDVERPERPDNSGSGRDRPEKVERPAKEDHSGKD